MIQDSLRPINLNSVLNAVVVANHNAGNDKMKVNAQGKKGI